VGEEDLNPEFTRCVEKGKIVTFAKGPSLASWPGLFWVTMFMGFESRVWDCAGEIARQLGVCTPAIAKAIRKRREKIS
jgi:hypothetical protein